MVAVRGRISDAKQQLPEAFPRSLPPWPAKDQALRPASCHDAPGPIEQEWAPELQLSEVVRSEHIQLTNIAAPTAACKASQDACMPSLVSTTTCSTIGLGIPPN